jgi:hypothetical protein
MTRPITTALRGGQGGRYECSAAAAAVSRAPGVIPVAVVLYDRRA